MFRKTRKAVSVGILGTAAMLANLSATACDTAPVYEKQGTYATKVRFDDLNLDRQAGAETLYKRLESAARRVCGSREARAALLHHIPNREQCRSDALQRAVEGIDNTHLTAVHRNQTGNHPRTGQELATLSR